MKIHFYYFTAMDRERNFYTEQITSPHRRVIGEVNLSEDSITDMEPSVPSESPLSQELLTPTVQPAAVTPHSTAQRSLGPDFETFRDEETYPHHEEEECVPATQMMPISPNERSETFESRLQIAQLLKAFSTTAREIIPLTAAATATARDSETAHVNDQNSAIGLSSAGPDYTVPASDEEGWDGGGYANNYVNNGGGRSVYGGRFG